MHTTKKNEPAERQRHRTAGDHARQEESGKELHLHALHVGHGSKHRHHHRDDQRRDGLRVPPCRHDIRLAGGLQQRVRVDWHDCGRQHHECGIADIVDDHFFSRVVSFALGSGICSGAVSVAMSDVGADAGAVARSDMIVDSFE